MLYFMHNSIFFEWVIMCNLYQFILNDSEMKILSVSVYLLIFLVCVLAYTKSSQKWSINVISRSFPWKMSIKVTFLFRGLFLVYHLMRSILPMTVMSTAHAVLETVLPTHSSWVYSIAQHCVCRILTVNLFRSSG